LTWQITTVENTIQVRQVLENSVCQYAGPREHEFATSVNFDAVCAADTRLSRA
jgi:hypothetical protein